MIVQSDRASGTRHTAQFALDQSRPLAVVRPPPDESGNPAWGLNLDLIDRADLVVDVPIPGNVFDAVLL